MEFIENKSILITGATGFVGKHLLSRICKKNKIRVFVRKPTQEIKNLEAKVLIGDIRDAFAVEKAVKGTDLVIHLASVLRSNDEKLNYGINVNGTKNIVDACKKYKSKLIHISTVNVLAERKGAYGKTKELAEQAVLESGIDYIILRCSLIYGRGNPMTDKIMKIFSFPIVPMMGDGKNRMQPVYVGDVVDAILRSAHKNKKIYNVAGPDIITAEQFKDMIINKLGKKRYTIHIPLPLVIAGASILSMLFKNPPITKEQALDFREDRIIDISASKKDLGFNPISFENGIDKYFNKSGDL